MGIVTAIGRYFGKSENVEAMIRQVAMSLEKAQIDQLRELARAWWPQPMSGKSFGQEMETRMCYYRIAMRADMIDEMKRRFPKTWEKLDQLNLPLVHKQIKDLSRVFATKSTFKLMIKGGKPADDARQEKVEQIIDRSGAHSVMKYADEVTQTVNRSATKAWWDPDMRRARISAWPCHQVDVVPDPTLWWSTDAAPAVLFELPGIDGLGSRRWELWGRRADSLGGGGLHFVTDGKEIFHVNAKDENPFRHPVTGVPIYPFVWWRNDSSTSLYSLGNEEMLNVNRRVNSTFADLDYAIRYKAWPATVHSVDKDAPATVFGTKVIGPSEVIELGPGCRLDNLESTLPIADVSALLQDLIKMNALMSGLASSSVQFDQSAPESGYAKKLQDRPLLEHRENSIEIYRPSVEEQVYRLLIVHNTYAEPADRVNLSDVESVSWTPGDVDLSISPKELDDVYSVEVLQGVASKLEWRMARTGEGREEAQEALDAIAEEKAAQPKPEVQPGEPGQPGQPGRPILSLFGRKPTGPMMPEEKPAQE
jgi:hypothetical protein